MAIKKAAQENIPVGEELNSITTDQEMTLKEYIQFYHVAPDIELDGEKVWPCDADYNYY